MACTLCLFVLSLLLLSGPLLCVGMPKPYCLGCPLHQQLALCIHCLVDGRELDPFIHHLNGGRGLKVYVQDLSSVFFMDWPPLVGWITGLIPAYLGDHPVIPVQVPLGGDAPWLGHGTAVVLQLKAQTCLSLLPQFQLLDQCCFQPRVERNSYFQVH